MAEIKISEYQLEDGVLVFNSGGDDKTLEVIVRDFNRPYDLFVNVYDTDGKNMVGLYNAVCSSEDDEWGDLWECRFLSQENVSDIPSEGYISFMYDSNGVMEELEIPYYVRYDGEGLIHPFVSNITFNADGTPEKIGYDRLTVGYMGLGTVDDIDADADWVYIQEDGIEEGNYYDEEYTFLIEVSPNTGSSRVANITLSMTDRKNKPKTTTVTITQKAAEEVDPDEPELPTDNEGETYSPIWKDIYYTFTLDTSYNIYEEVKVFVNSNIGTITEERLIYSGKVFVPPTDDAVNVMINKVCQNYFDDNELIEDDYVGQNHNFKKFILRGEYGQKLHTYYFVNDWSYEPLTVGIKTNPIIPVIVDGQKLFFSAFSDSTQRGYKWGMEYYDGTEDYVNTEYVKNNFYSLFVLPSRGKGVSKFYFGNRECNMIPKCKAQYVLYYIGPKGEWNWFPIMGKVTKTDSITQYTYSNNYNNTTYQFGKYRYLTEISTKYNLNTGYLTEKQSLRMWELLESNCVYLHNVVEDKIYPVLIADNEVEHKKKERNRKMISYSINVECSQTRERI